MAWAADKALSVANLTDLEDRIAAADALVTGGKSNIYDAIVVKNSTPAGTTFAQLVTAIGAIVLGSGNAVVADVLAAKTFTNSGGVELTGIMTDRTGDTASLSSSVATNTLKLLASDGYRDGVNDNVTITDNDWITTNIKDGVDILGKTGTYKAVNLTAGTNILVDGGASSASNANYVKVRDIDITYPGTYRIKFTLAAGNAGYNAYGRIYNNGTPVGTERTTADAGYTEYSEDIALAAGDNVQLYMHDTDAQGAESQYFRICIAEVFATTVL